MAKPGQRVVKGVLPQFKNIGNKPKAQTERGAHCERCGVQSEGKGSIQTQTIGEQAMKVCGNCSDQRDKIASGVLSELHNIEIRAMERFRNARGKESMVAIGPMRKRKKTW